ncbi:MAG: bifunctional oligoribonuclease/PAP phosphatase NrnA [Firmicutes bacterium]|nr:bifunctional oligoribonuclease/PAP phosphatase NrnA [Bacillota bacterium]
MKSNASLKELAGFLKAAETILIFTHTNPDGDALGSAAALCRVLRKMGKISWILMDEEVPEYISFMDTEFVTRDKECLKDHDVSICVDCGEYSRFPALADKFDEGKLHLCVDHHATGDGFGDHYYIDPSEAATCQLIYKLIKELEAVVAESGETAGQVALIDRQVAESIYTGINTDTGSFQYSNTTADTHAIASDLMTYGVDHTAINVKLYQAIPMTKLKIQAAILQKAEFLFGGKVAVGYVTGQMLEEAGAVLDDAEGTIDMLRNIEGVEIAAFLKEKGEAVKVSMRAKSYANVAEIVSVFGGGGHVKAAGCTLEMGMDEALDAIKKAIGEHF